MTIQNGYVPADYLVTFQGLQVAACIYPDLVAAEAEFHGSGYSFSLQPPGGGNRPAAMQGAMQTAYDLGQYQRAPWWLSPPPSPRPANIGQSRHGYAKAIDVVSNAPLKTRDAILARHGFKLWSTSDRNHYEWGNVLSPAGLVPASSLGLQPAGTGGSTPLEEDDMFTDQDRYQQAVIIQLLTATAAKDGWDGALTTLGVINKNVGEIHQAIFETQQWKGLGAVAGETLAAVTDIQSKLATLGTAGIDEDALAQQVVDLLAKAPDELAAAIAAKLHIPNTFKIEGTASA